MVKPRDNRIPIMFSNEELSDIDDWRFACRIATRADAVRRLCKIALFVKNELEQIVDLASDGVKILSGQSSDLWAVYRQVVHKDNADLVFGQDEVTDVFRLANDHAEVAEEGIQGLHQMIVTLYNVIAAIVDAKTIRSGTKESEKRLAEAHEAVQRANDKQAEREENRYIALLYMIETPDERAAYNALPEEEKDDYLGKRIDKLRAEEAADPRAFLERYNIPPPFWEKAGWEIRLRQRAGKDDRGLDNAR